MKEISLNKEFKLQLSLNTTAKDLQMIWVDGSTFRMGYSNDPNLILDDKPFDMTLSKGFWLGRFMITQAQWQAVMEGDPSSQKEDNFPIDCVSWDDALKFCEKLNLQYSSSLPEGYKFSLPTEAQWEYSCKANTLSRNYGGNAPEETLEIAWCLENSDKEIHEVGLKQPNAWGFYDMFGNLFEWCFDMIKDYPREQAIDWIGISDLGFDGGCSRVIRGGCYLNPLDDDSFNSAGRTYIDSDVQQTGYGFRLSLREYKES
jgi:formylglycine-generating enzyme required for sulfatase activity